MLWPTELRRQCRRCGRHGRRVYGSAHPPDVRRSGCRRGAASRPAGSCPPPCRCTRCPGCRPCAGAPPGQQPPRRELLRQPGRPLVRRRGVVHGADHQDRRRPLGGHRCGLSTAGTGHWVQLSAPQPMASPSGGYLVFSASAAASTSATSRRSPKSGSTSPGSPPGSARSGRSCPAPGTRRRARAASSRRRSGPPSAPATGPAELGVCSACPIPVIIRLWVSRRVEVRSGAASACSTSAPTWPIACSAVPRSGSRDRPGSPRRRRAAPGRSRGLALDVLRRGQRRVHRAVQRNRPTRHGKVCAYQAPGRSRTRCRGRPAASRPAPTAARPCPGPR